MNFPSERILRLAIAFFTVVGIGVATYILISNSTSGAPACFAGGTGCETVAKSSYSHILGINVAVFGIIGWILIFGTVFFGSDVARLAGFLFTLGGFGFSIYLTYLEIWNIEAICQWCVTNAVLMTICFLLNIARLLRYVGTPDGGSVIGRGGGAGTARPIAEDG
jgi:uncharacterized membrane protein